MCLRKPSEVSSCSVFCVCCGSCLSACAGKDEALGCEGGCGTRRTDEPFVETDAVDEDPVDMSPLSLITTVANDLGSLSQLLPRKITTVRHNLDIYNIYIYYIALL